MRPSLLIATYLTIVFSVNRIDAQQFDIRPISPLDTEHTRNDGYRYGFVSQMNATGWVVGASDRFNGTSNNLGRSAWFFNGTDTRLVGLLDSEHTSSTGIRDNYAVRVTDSGRILGLASRYSGTSSYKGQSIWVSDGASTTKVGLTGTSFTRSDGLQTNNYQDFNEAGKVFGRTDRFSGTTPIGQSVWYYNGTVTNEIGLLDNQHTTATGFRQNEALQSFHGEYVLGTSFRNDASNVWKGLSAWVSNGTTTTQLGFTDAQYTRNDGWKDSRPIDGNGQGHVVGYSNRYDGTNTLLERSSWFYNGSNTVKIGLTDVMHTNSSGFRSSEVVALSETGHSSGLSARYNGGSVFLGQSAWSFNGTAHRQIGLYSAEYTRNTGRIDNAIAITSESGGVTGYADRWNGGTTYLGRNAWVDNGSSTTKIGLTDGMHTRSDGFQHSSIMGFSINGTVAGTSLRYNSGNVDLGQSAWHFDGTTTRSIGLVASEYFRNDGYHNSVINFTNINGQVVGYADRFIGATAKGQSAWIFDPTSSLTFDLTLSIDSTGYAFSRAMYLGENGIVLGEYTLFSSSGLSQGNRAFYFSVNEGLFDLGGLVELGLVANNWESLSISLLGNQIGSIAGYGKRIGSVGDSRVVFNMNKISAVPEPSSAGMLLAATIGIGLFRFRKKSLGC